MKRTINYAHLAQKYIQGADFIMEDRTYDGLVWRGPGVKPPRSFFESAQAEEEREARKVGRQVAIQDDLMAERQGQARAKIAAEMVDFEEKVRASEEIIRQEIRAQREEAIELQSALRLRDELLDSWHEISAAQAVVNAEAQAYLKDTDFYVTRAAELGTDIPEQVLQDRAKARERVVSGRLVYANWQKLRENEMPTREEMQAAIKKGGQELDRIRSIVNDVALKYAKPQRESSFRG